MSHAGTDNDSSSNAMETDLAALSLQPTTESPNASASASASASSAPTSAPSLASSASSCASVSAPVSHASLPAMLDIENPHSVPNSDDRRLPQPPIVRCAASAVTAPAPVSHADFPAVLDIEDLRSVTICGLRRARPPIVPFLCPFRLHLEVGKTYRYCTCGRSEEQPWCDDSHLARDPQPIEFTVSTEQTWHLLCGCKYSLKQPFCDGSHIHAVDGYEEVSTVPVIPTTTGGASESTGSR